jgi:DNA-binding CsgD family transcriptional regulator
MNEEKFSIIEKFKLSPREFDCLVLALYGFSIKRMAKLLGISAKTAEGYTRDTCMKLHTSRKDCLHATLESFGVKYLSVCMSHYIELTQHTKSLSQ